MTTRPPYDAEVYLQVVPRWPKSPATGNATVVKATQTKPRVVSEGARLIKVRLVIPRSVLDPVPVQVVVVEVPEAEAEAVTGEASPS